MIQTPKSNNAVRVNLFRQITNILFAGDALSYYHDQQFSTKDRDNDESNRNCATVRQGAFWYGRCEYYYANLNGEYLGNVTIDGLGVTWWMWKRHYSLKQMEMKIKPN